jgi:glutamine amidotransferase
VDLTESGRSHALLGPAFGDAAQFFYHVHSYYPTELPEQAVLGTGDYGGVFPTLVGRGTVIGAQFHPEKSQQAGIELLSAFAQWKP